MELLEPREGKNTLRGPFAICGSRVVIRSSSQVWAGPVFVHGNLNPHFILALFSRSSHQAVPKMRLLCLPNPSPAELRALGHPAAEGPGRPLWAIRWLPARPTAEQAAEAQSAAGCGCSRDCSCPAVHIQPRGLEGWGLLQVSRSIWSPKPCSFLMIAVLQSISLQCCQLTDFLCSFSQCPAYHFYKSLIPSPDLLSFPLPFLHHIHHHVPYLAFISPFKTWTFSSLHSYLSSFWSWFGLQIHRSGEAGSVPVQHRAELLQEGLSHDCGSLGAGVRSVMPSPLRLQYYR